MKRSYPALALGLALALLLGLSGPVSSATAARLAQTTATATPCATEYVVKSGDWIRQIARQFNVDWRAMVSVNKLTTPDWIYPGQKLCIPAQTLTSPTPTRTPAAATPTRTATATGPTPTATRTSTAAPSATPRPTLAVTVPTFRIVGVVRDQSVTIETRDFPAGLKFDVRLGAMGTRGLGGTLVTTQDSGQGGTFTATYSLPAALKGADQVAIRLENSASGYYAFNWFYNNNAP